ncbi:hypothetical protein RJ639_032585 [Escallonia herrerae]|uniref:Ubiquitin-like domain-containing protein n=1 Tax=Escallonia herrerae TaxID=1293975 RepID=A0AA89BC49_9ASTE|nr:hypothetical protein RJ639_032585 [Escallonia herrerae]
MDVIFETPRGRKFSIEIGFFDSVLEIKEKIQKYQGIPISKQTLVFKDQVLHDEQKVESSEILQDSRIHLLITPKSEEGSSSPSSSTVRLQLIMLAPRTPKAIEADQNHTVLQLKEKISEAEGVLAAQLVLHFSGSELQDHLFLRDCELFDNSEIHVSVGPANSIPMSPSSGGSSPSQKKLKIKVLTQCGTKKIAMEVNPSDNVREMRKELEKLQKLLNFHLPQEGYFFIYKQNVMDDDRSFRWHHVSNGDTIEIFNGSVTGGLTS